MSDALIIAEDEQEERPEHRHSNYSLHTTIQTPLIRNPTEKNDSTVKPYADIHLSINIFLPNRRKSMAVRPSRQVLLRVNYWNLFSSKNQPVMRALEMNIISIHFPMKRSLLLRTMTWIPLVRSHRHIMRTLPMDLCTSRINAVAVSIGRTGKPTCCTTFVSNTRSLKQKNPITHRWISSRHCAHFLPTRKPSAKYWKVKLLYSPCRSAIPPLFLCPDRLLLPKIDYTNCTWEELKSKLFLQDEAYRSCSSPEQKNEPFLSISIDEKHLHAIDSNQRLFDSLPSEWKQRKFLLIRSTLIDLTNEGWHRIFFSVHFSLISNQRRVM